MQLCSSDLWTQVPKSCTGAVLIVVLSVVNSFVPYLRWCLWLGQGHLKCPQSCCLLLLALSPCSTFHAGLALGWVISFCVDLLLITFMSSH